VLIYRRLRKDEERLARVPICMMESNEARNHSPPPSPFCFEAPPIRCLPSITGINPRSIYFIACSDFIRRASAFSFEFVLIRRVEACLSLPGHLAPYLLCFQGEKKGFVNQVGWEAIL
jgi:hypothetical protein